MYTKYFQIAKKIATFLTNRDEEFNDEEFNEWRAKDKNEKLLTKISEESSSHIEKYKKFSADKGWKAMKAKAASRKKHIIVRWIFSSAAVLAIGLGTVLIYLNSASKNAKIENNIIVAQSSGIKLIYENGSEQSLQETFKKEQDSCLTVSNNQNCLSYKISNQKKDIKPSLQKIVIPSKEEYKVILSDNTIVTLNANSSLKFPDFFTGNTRYVELKGEAYFQVEKNMNMPFIVKTESGTIKVYGTEFNVSAYSEDATSEITLIKGSVGVEQNGKEQKIKPGEQWCFDKKKNSISVEKVDISCVTAWKEGILKFKDARLEEIMQVISHWYGINVNYEIEALKDLRYGCNFNRNLDIEPLLRIFEANGKIKINKTGNELFIQAGLYLYQ